MAEKHVSLELLKTFSALLHRPVLSIPDDLDVARYHRSFLTKQAEKLSDPSKLPLFLNQLQG